MKKILIILLLTIATVLPTFATNWVQSVVNIIMLGRYAQPTTTTRVARDEVNTDDNQVNDSPEQKELQNTCPTKKFFGL